MNHELVEIMAHHKRIVQEHDTKKLLDLGEAMAYTKGPVQLDEATCSLFSHLLLLEVASRHFGAEIAASKEWQGLGTQFPGLDPDPSGT